MKNKNDFLNNLFQFISYTIVGASNVLIDLLVFNVLWKVTGHSHGNINYLFKFISFCIYSTTGYLLNKNVTFERNDTKNSHLKYVSLLAFLSFLDAVIISKLTLFHPSHIRHFYWNNLSVLFASIITGILGFIINKFLIFKK